MKYIFVDIDGVLTDGRITLDIHGNETKRICYRDLDAIAIGRRAGYDFVFVTGENTEMVHVLARRFAVERVYPGSKDKLNVMKEIAAEYGMQISEMLYIGDSDRDAPALKAVGLGIAPSDASDAAIAAADVLTNSMGGHGVLLEVVNKLISNELSFPGE